MYQTPVSLKPLLHPRDFVSAEFWEQEQVAVFAESWHLVATQRQLRKSGAYISVTLLGVPVLVRNFSGEIVALRNVCAHRQSLLATEPSGCSPTLKCPYHGWEYGADGRTRKLPGAANFPKFEHQHYCLDRFAVEVCGDLIFVRLSSTGPSLREWIGERFELFAAWFSVEEYHQAMYRRLEFAANWKIPVENSLESYHIPCVHPQTFHTDPAEAHSTHEFFETGTSFQARFHPPRWIDHALDRAEIWVMHRLGCVPDGMYQHHHVFPNLLISHTDSTSFVQMIHPVGPDRSFSLMWQYGRGGERLPFVPRVISRLWGQFTGALTRTIVLEDVPVYALVQSGAAGAGKPGLLGRCEERIHASQKYLRDRIDVWQAERHASRSKPDGAAASVSASLKTNQDND